MTRLRVVTTIADLGSDSGGPSRSCRSLTEALARAGATAQLFAGDHHRPASALLLPDPTLVTTRLVPIGRRFGLPDYRFAPAFATLPPGPAIHHDNGIWSPANVAAMHAAARHGLASVITIHGMLEPWALAHKPWRKRAAWALYQHRLLAAAAGIHATAEPERASIRARLPAADIAIIANGVDCPPAPDPARRVGAGERRVLMLSRLHPVKNLPGLVAAWAIIAADPGCDGWMLEIRGPDPDGYRPVVAAAIARAGLGDRIRLGDAVAEADKGAAFAAADLLVLPSFSENFGVVVAEALAHGVPVVASHGTPWADLPVRGCGWHVAPDPAALADALRAAMALPPEARAAMGQRGYHFALAAFGWQRIAAQMLDFYTWIAGGKTAPAPDFVERGQRSWRTAPHSAGQHRLQGQSAQEADTGTQRPLS